MNRRGDSELPLGKSAQAFRALGDETRLRILILLSAAPRPAGDIVAEFNLAQSTISRHLAVLKQAGLVRSERDRQHIIYELCPEALTECWRSFANAMNER